MSEPTTPYQLLANYLRHDLTKTPEAGDGFVALLDEVVKEARANADRELRELRKAANGVSKAFSSFNDDEGAYEQLGDAVMALRKALAERKS